jgi:transglutaminase-like putative cysteine protease
MTAQPLDDLAPALASDAHLDADHPAVVAFARAHGGGLAPRQAAVALYYAVRDGFRYTPWRVSLTPGGFRASLLLERDPPEGHCIDKALLLAAACRALGIPARLHFANVRNHVGTVRIEARLGSDLLVYHGYTELFLGGRWVAATPAFNRALCERLGVAPLEFDGENDSIFQPYDREAGRFMEYVTDHGSHTALPFDAMMAEWARYYPAVRDGGWPTP